MQNKDCIDEKMFTFHIATETQQIKKTTSILTHTLLYLRSRHNGTQKDIRKTLSANSKAT